MIDSQEGWVSPSNYTDTLLHTTDGGNTWSKIAMGTKNFWQGITFMDKDTGWLAGGSSGQGLIYKTTDGGENWEADYSGNEQLRFITAPVSGLKTVWAGGIGGNVLKFAPCHSSPEISNLQGDSSPCIGDGIIYEVNQTGIDIFTWSIPEDWVVWGRTNTANLEVIVGEASGQITVKGANSCGDETALLGMDINTETVPIPIIYSENEILTTDASNVKSYSWILNGIKVDGANVPIFIPVKSGDYTLMIEYNSGCIRTSNSIYFLATSIDELSDS